MKSPHRVICSEGVVPPLLRCCQVLFELRVRAHAIAREKLNFRVSASIKRPWASVGHGKVVFLGVKVWNQGYENVLSLATHLWFHPMTGATNSNHLCKSAGHFDKQWRMQSPPLVSSPDYCVTDSLGECHIAVLWNWNAASALDYVLSHDTISA